MIDEDARIIGIIGAGAKGRQIAVCALLGGYRVILADISSSILAEAEGQITTALAAEVAREKVVRPGKQKLAANLSTTQSMSEVSRGADLLIEAVPEDAESQLEIFTIFDKFAKPAAILASTALSVSIADLAEMTNCPERCAGLQFPDPPPDDQSLRILRAPNTSDCTMQFCAYFARKIGFEPRLMREAVISITVAPGTQTP
ncbi:MAG: 3-hydroxyacyl-CoA dehydrogenase NAD-binding domain-containing protein [Candidatus Acidiferrales bacterium]